MSLKIYNSLTKQKEDFIPLNQNIVNMYSCGVTVYDKCHIGHARSLYIFSVIKNYLNFLGYHVNFVRNITDVDDKIIAKANLVHKSFEEVVRENIDFYHKDLNSLGISKANTAEPRATENIEDMVVYIEKLIAKNYAYAVDGDVYFSVRSFKTYGRLSGQSVDKMLEAVRIDHDDKKKDPLDFALWKKSKPGEPFWSSPWGNGRPGWHIECSVMSQKYLKCETLDIHAGGRDLIFPHHENEIAQAEALTDKPFAKYWIHHGLLKINGQKMAKSLGNFITVEDALNKFSVNQLKLFFLASHYVSEIDFTEEKMSEAQKAEERIESLLIKFQQKFGDRLSNDAEGGGNAGAFKDKFVESMNDDFNTPKALAVLFELMKACNTEFESGHHQSDFNLAHAGDILKEILDVLGLSFNLKKTSDLITEQEIEHFLEERLQARTSKNFKRSDEIRDLLKHKGVIVEDGKDGQRWHWM